MQRTFRVALAAALCAAGAAAADTGQTYTKESYPTELIKRPLELPAGMLQIDLSLDINLSKSLPEVGDAVIGPFKPFLIGFAANYGVDGKLQVGVSSSGLCFNSDACGLGTGGSHVFNDLAFEGDYQILHQTGLDAALQAAFLINSIADPFTAALALGVDLRLVQQQFAIRAGPKLVFGLNQRDAGNREAIDIPLAFQYQVDPHLALQLRTDILLAIDPPDPYGFGDFIKIPVQLHALYAVSKDLDVGAYFAFTNLLGKQASGQNGLDGRQFGIFGSFRL